MTKGVSARQQREDRLRLRRKRLQDASGALQGAKVPLPAVPVPTKPGRLHRPWRARIFVNGRDRSLGYFNTKEEARQAHADAARHLGIKLKSEGKPCASS
jgi:hypothetical protein